MKKTAFFLSIVGSVSFAVTLLSGCGGSDDAAVVPPSANLVAQTPPAPVTPTASVTAASLVISSATPATANGTLNKTDAGAQYESTIGNSTGGFSSSSPNDYCRVAAYELPNNGDGIKYTLEVVFAKTTKVASYAILRRSTGTPIFAARSIEPSLTGITVDVTNRRLGFSNVVLGGAGSTNSATLNGSLEYPTNGSSADRANCG